VAWLTILVIIENGNVGTLQLNHSEEDDHVRKCIERNSQEAIYLKQFSINLSGVNKSRVVIPKYVSEAICLMFANDLTVTMSRL
jgi:hypothetical protein